MVNRGMRALSQGSIGKVETKKPARRAKVRQSKAFLESGIDLPERLAGLGATGFFRMTHSRHGGAQLLKPRPLAARRLQSAGERIVCFFTSAETEERFAAKAAYEGQRLRFAARFSQGKRLVKYCQRLDRIPERFAGGADIGKLERTELPALLGGGGRNRGLHGLDSRGGIALPGLERAANEARPMFEQRQLVLLAVGNRFVGIVDGIGQRRAV